MNVHSKWLIFNLNKLMYIILLFLQGYYPFKLTLDDDKFMRIFPSGDYKKIMTLSNGIDNKIIKIVMDSTLKPQQ